MISFKEYITELSDSAIKRAKVRFNGVDWGAKYVDHFNDLQNKHIITGVDIFSLSTTQLKDLVDKHLNKQTKTQQKKKFHDFDAKNAKLIFKNNKVSVFRILNHEMSCKLGTGTTWCISVKDSPKHWNNYKSNNIYFMITKEPYKINMGEGMIDTVKKYAVIVSDGIIDTVWNNMDDDIYNSSDESAREKAESDLGSKDNWVDHQMSYENIKDEDERQSHIEGYEEQYDDKIQSMIDEYMDGQEEVLSSLLRKYNINRKIFK